MNNNKNHTQASSKLSIELREYEIFCAKFDKGLFGAQRFSQAKDGDHARRSIQNLFEFT